MRMTTEGHSNSSLRALTVCWPETEWNGRGSCRGSRFTSGAIDADSALGQSGGGKGAGRGKGKGKGKGRWRGQWDQSLASSTAAKTEGICHMHVRHGKCANDECPYSQLSQDQVKRALGQGGSDQRDTSRGSNDADKASRGRGKRTRKGETWQEAWPVAVQWTKDKDANSAPL